MKRIRITTNHRLAGILLVSLLGTLLTVGVSIFQLRSTIAQDRDVQTKSVVETALGVVKYFGSLEEQGTLTRAQAQQQAIAALKAFRYNDDEYFWINDMGPRMIMHPMKPELDGTDLSQTKDPAGVHLFQEFVRVVQASGAGFVAYEWPKPGKDAPQPKTSYVAGYSPWGWVLGSGVYTDDVAAAATQRGLQLTLVLLPMGLLVAGLSFVVIQSVLRPLRRNVNLARDTLENFDLAFRFPVSAANDEIDQLNAALNDTLARIGGIVDGVTETARGLDRQAANLVDASRDMDASARQTADQAGSVVTVMSQVTQYVETLSAGTDETGASIGAIAKAAARVAGAAVVAAQTTNQTVVRLGDSSREINEVVKAITSIAEQTNLLALNATIEAARAGEAGKGFSVVASEVKELAQESASATDDITRRVSAMQADVEGAVAAIADISGVISQISDYQTAIAAAVEEQTATTQEMNRGVASTADDGRSAASSAETMEALAQITLNRVAGVNAAAEELVQMASRLNVMVADYTRSA